MWSVKRIWSMDVDVERDGIWIWNEIKYYDGMKVKIEWKWNEMKYGVKWNEFAFCILQTWIFNYRKEEWKYRMLESSDFHPVLSA